MVPCRCRSFRTPCLVVKPCRNTPEPFSVLILLSFEYCRCHAYLMGMSRYEIPISGPRLGPERPFRPRLGRGSRDHSASFLTRVDKSVTKARAISGRTKYSGTSGRFNARGRGAKLASMLMTTYYGWQSYRSGDRFGGTVTTRARRAIVKARVVKLKTASGGRRHSQPFVYL